MDGKGGGRIKKTVIQIKEYGNLQVSGAREPQAV
jgi:hypothetical protein